MKYIIIFAIAVLLLACKNDKSSTTFQDLLVIDQNYYEALDVASKEDKLLFIDFYTSWCAPCKKLDRLVFQNDSIKQILKNDFVLLRYNAENDTVFHLSKKHHLSSYPTGITLNKNGFILNRKYGFPGEDFQTLSKSVLEFTNEAISLNKENKILKGYSNKVDDSKYPKFYVDYVNRTNTKINPLELNEYWHEAQDVFSEEYFSTLLYFAREASDNIANTTIKNREKYLELYGKTDVEILMYFLTSGKFERAILEKSQRKYDKAVVFAKNALSKKWTGDILPSFKKDFLIAKNKWDEVFEINESLKNNGDFSSGAINHFCWTVYKKCDNQKVIKKCLGWMKEITEKEPNYAFLDTYSFLMYKSGNKAGTKRIAQLTIEAAKKENENTKDLEELLKKL